MSEYGITVTSKSSGKRRFVYDGKNVQTYRSRAAAQKFIDKHLKTKSARRLMSMPRVKKL